VLPPKGHLEFIARIRIFSQIYFAPQHDFRKLFLNHLLGAQPAQTESGRFLKKAAPKTFVYAGAWALAPTQPEAQHNTVFLLLFVHKK
jgi:hypothetical protein